MTKTKRLKLVLAGFIAFTTSFVWTVLPVHGGQAPASSVKVESPSK
jgi:hypothetical protein